MNCQNAAPVWMSAVNPARAFWAIVNILINSATFAAGAGNNIVVALVAK
jgi:hypothetical protein